MKVKDLVDMKGCYSAHDVGELEVPVLSVEDITEIIDKWFWGKETKPTKDLAETIHKAMVKKRRKA